MDKIIVTVFFSFLIVSSSILAQEIPDYVPTDGLIGWYPFNGNANDESGNGNNGNVSGPNLTFDRFGTINAAYAFEGGTEIITISSPFSSGVNEMTILAWFKPEFSGASSNQVISVFQQDGPLNDGVCYLSYYPNPANLKFGYGSNNQNFANVITENPSQEWHCAVLVYDGIMLKSYMDNILVGSSNVSPAEYSCAAPFAIGNLNSNPVQGFIGQIDDVGIWNRGLTEAEIANLYNACINSTPATITSNGSTTFCDGGFVQLSANTGVSYQWSNGATTQTITATQNGSYTVTIYDDEGCSATSEPVEVTVLPVPSSAVSISGETNLCEGESVTLTAQGTGSYLWSNGLASQSIVVETSGDYTVTVTQNGCSATSQPIPVTVTPSPEASITANGSTTFCEGGFVQLTAQGNGTYQWNTGETTQSITVTLGGDYSVMVSNNGCSDVSDLLSVTVNLLPTVSLNAMDAICENAQAVELSGGFPDGGNYEVNGSLAAQLNPSQTGSGVHSVEYFYTDENGCSNSATTNVTVHEVEEATLLGLNTSYLLDDGPDELIGEPSGGVFSGSGVSDNTFDPSQAGLGIHNVSYAVIDNNGCISLTGLCTTVDKITGGQSDEGFDENFIVYPNPSSGLFNIEISDVFGVAAISVLDAKGKVVFKDEFYSNGRRIERIVDLSDLANSIYFLQLRTNKGVKVKKVMKK